MVLRLLLAEDSFPIREGLAALLAGDPVWTSSPSSGRYRPGWRRSRRSDPMLS